MHRCLSIAEVQHTIFQEVYQDSDCRSRSTVAGLARTCRTFNSVALDVLWARLDSFTSLLRCLPRDLWKLEPENGAVTFQRPMWRSDWEIFFRYSSRVRTLNQRYGTGVLARRSALDDDVIFTLSNPPTPGPLIPHLKTLYWTKLGKNNASLVRLLLTSSLASLSLSICDLNLLQMSIFTSVSSICPSLKHLSISWDRLPGEILDVSNKILSETLLHMQSLESLNCPACNKAMMVAISLLPSLLHLDLKLKSNFQVDKVRPRMALPHTSSSLRTLKLDVDTFPTLTSFVEAMWFRLESLSFVVAEKPTSKKLRQFFSALSTACSSEKPLHISLSSKYSGGYYGHQRLEDSLSTFRSLLQLPNVHSFEFNVPCGIALDNDGITTLADHWPELTKLTLKSEQSLIHRSGMTHKGFLSLLSRCTELTELTIEVDFSHIDFALGEGILNKRLGGGVTNHKCTRINFLMSSIRYPSTIAAFLCDVCPQLKEVKSSWGDDSPDTCSSAETDLEVMQPRWEEVKNLLPVFFAVRRQSKVD